MSGSSFSSQINKINVRGDQAQALLPEPKSALAVQSAVLRIQEIGKDAEKEVSPLKPADVKVETSLDNSFVQFPAAIKIIGPSRSSTEISTESLKQPPSSIPSTITLSYNQPAGQVNREVEDSTKISPKIMDTGLSAALEYFVMGNEKLLKTKDKYAMLLSKSIFLNSEAQAIVTIKSWDDETQKFFLTETIKFGTDEDHCILLNSLRLVAIQGRFSLLSFLLNKMKEYHLNIKDTEWEDKFGWNLAHFVALHFNRTFPLQDIPEISNLYRCINKAGATPIDFTEWLSEPEPVPVSAFGKTIPPLNPEQFLKCTKSKYWIRPHFTPGAVLRLCFERPSFDQPEYLSTLLSKKIDLYLDNIKNQPCKLMIKKMTGTNVPKELQGEWECLLSQDIAKGEIIALYTGTVFHTKWSRSVEVKGKALQAGENFFVDADQGGGSLAQFINHGFPNCAPIAHIYRGFPLIAIVALENLKANTTLYMSYGPDYFTARKMVPVNLNQLGIQSYLRETQDIKNIPFVEIAPDGTGYAEGKNGATHFRKTKEPVSEPQAIDAWCNNIRLEYLACYNSSELAKKLDISTYMWLTENFKK